MVLPACRIDRRLLVVGLLTVASTTTLFAQRQTKPAAGSLISTAAKCAADLGRGQKSRRTFCDVLIGGSGPASVVIAVPPHRGRPVLMFDLHNRFTVPPQGTAPADAYVQHVAVVQVLAAGEVLERAVVAREFRTVADLFDRVTAPSGAVRAVAPGFPEAVRLVLPETATSIAITGGRLEETTRAGQARLQSPGRPVALVSNIRLEYVAR